MLEKLFLLSKSCALSVMSGIKKEKPAQMPMKTRKRKHNLENWEHYFYCTLQSIFYEKFLIDDVRTSVRPSQQSSAIGVRIEASDK